MSRFLRARTTSVLYNYIRQETPSDMPLLDGRHAERIFMSVTIRKIANYSMRLITIQE